MSSVNGRASSILHMTNDSIEELFHRTDARIARGTYFFHHELSRASEARSILEDLEGMSVVVSLARLEAPGMGIGTEGLV